MYLRLRIRKVLEQVSFFTFIAVIVTIFFLILLTPTLGLIGAAYSALLGSIIRLSLVYCVDFSRFKRYHKDISK